MKNNYTHERSIYMRGKLLSLLIIATIFLSQPQAALAATGCPPGMHCLFLPGVANTAPTGDLILSGIEVTQSVQDLKNSVPLVEGRRTIVRIYARSGDTSTPLSNVQILVTANSSGASLSSSPAAMTSTVPLANNRSDYNSTINYELPNSWLHGTIDLTIRLDPGDRIVETDESNNDYQLRLTFNPVPPLQIKIVPIRYTHSNGQVYPAPTADSISDWISRTYPVSQVDISWHAAYSFSDNLSLSQSWYKLLDQVTTLKSAEGAPSSQVYYALVPVTNGDSTWFTGGVAGIGWIGSRTAVGLNTSSGAQIAAHEIGHNLGMWHSPCGSPSSVDPNYPYADGSIGQYGLDVASRTVYPPSYRDVMSYCNPRWVSDYTYKVLYRSQVLYGGSPQLAQALPESSDQRSLLVRYRFDPDGIQTMPLYVLPQSASALPEAGEYTVQIVDADGGLLSETPVKAYQMGLDGEERSAIHTVLPLPDGPVARIRLLKDSQVLSEQPLQADAPQETIRTMAPAGGETSRVHWTASDRPALVRYSADGGQTWTILGVDVSGGEMPVAASTLSDPDSRFEVVLAGAW